MPLARRLLFADLGVLEDEEAYQAAEGETPPDSNCSNEQEIRAALADGRNGVAKWIAQQLIEEHDLPLDPSAPHGLDFRWFCRYILRALLELIERDREHARGVFYGEPKDPFLTASAASAPSAAVAAIVTAARGHFLCGTEQAQSRSRDGMPR